MNPRTQEQEFFKYFISQLIDEQRKTNELLSQLLAKKEATKNAKHRDTTN